MTQVEVADVGLQTRLITPQRVWNEYGIPVASQKDLRKAGQFVPVIRVGGRLYYRRELLERWLDEHTAQIPYEDPQAVENPVENGDVVEIGRGVPATRPADQGSNRCGSADVP